MLTRLKNTLVGLLLYAGFTLIDYLSSQDALFLISQDVQKFFLRNKFLFYGIILLTYVIQQVLRDLPKPVDMSNAHELQPVVRSYLEHALTDYSNLVRESGAAIIPTVRINVMLKTRDQPFNNGKLRIIYSLGYIIEKNKKDRDTLRFIEPCYSGAEETELWKRGQGSCGAAWKKGDLTIFDSINPMFQSPIDNLSKHQKDITREVNSVLSIPLWLHGKVIGVLNIDSQKNITETRFDDRTIYSRLDDYVDSLAKICAIFIDGIQV